MYDLLDAAAGEGGLQVREDQKRGTYVENLGVEAVASADAAAEVLLRGYRNRRVGETAMNRESSRSHAVFQLSVESVEKVEDGAGDDATRAVPMTPRWGRVTTWPFSGTPRRDADCRVHQQTAAQLDGAEHQDEVCSL